MIAGVYLETTSGYDHFLAPNSPVMFNIRWDTHELYPKQYVWGKKRFADDLKATGHTIILNIKACPAFYRKDTEYVCSQPKQSYYNDFANFAVEACKQYHADYVELWNEPDVSKKSVPPDWWYYGCWGTKGEKYAKFVTQVYPLIKHQLPDVQVCAGALLNADPKYITPLVSAKYDIFTLHSYVYYGQPFTITQDNLNLVRKSIKKPILITETSLLTRGDPLNQDFRNEQGKYYDYLLSLNGQKNYLGFVWYTLMGNGWMGSDLYYKTAHPAYVNYRKYYAQ